MGAALDINPLKHLRNHRSISNLCISMLFMLCESRKFKQEDLGSTRHCGCESHVASMHRPWQQVQQTMGRGDCTSTATYGLGAYHLIIY